MKILTVALAGLLASAASPSHHQVENWCGAPFLAYDDSAKNDVIVTLTGFLTTRFAWGPPNFGEKPRTDSSWRPWVLRLDYATPVTLTDYAKSPPTQEHIVVTRVQVRGPMEINGGLAEFRNRHVAIEGMLWQWEAPSDVEPVVMNATQVRFTRDVDCFGRAKPQRS